MGMYNEVYKKCPHCPDGVGYLQIHQIVLGFGNFNLDDPVSLENFTTEELQELKETLQDKIFRCETPGYTSFGKGNEEDFDICSRSFRFQDKDHSDARKKLLDELTGRSSNNVEQT